MCIFPINDIYCFTNQSELYASVCQQKCRENISISNIHLQERKQWRGSEAGFTYCRPQCISDYIVVFQLARVLCKLAKGRPRQRELSFLVTFRNPSYKYKNTVLLPNLTLLCNNIKYLMSRKLSSTYVFEISIAEESCTVFQRILVHLSLGVICSTSPSTVPLFSTVTERRLCMPLPWAPHQGPDKRGDIQ